ncbi:hypothetical protein EDD21DRAFT_373761 [Dissophora ornata]|nr:hypothetical protein EDD21DRAFT_373761 [Dissophora ornata]
MAAVVAASCDVLRRVGRGRKVQSKTIEVVGVSYVDRAIITEITARVVADHVGITLDGGYAKNHWNLNIVIVCHGLLWLLVVLLLLWLLRFVGVCLLGWMLLNMLPCVLQVVRHFMRNTRSKSEGNDREGASKQEDK